MHRRTHLRRLLVALALTASAFGVPAHAETRPGPTPQIQCGPGSKPESVQGRVPQADYESGRARQGYSCNAEQVGHDGNTGGYRVYRYQDPAGHVCGYYDSSLFVGIGTVIDGTTGVVVLDMSDPAHPKRTALLQSPAMLSPHESLNLNVKRGLLAAIMATPATAPGIVDIYDLTGDCRHPKLRSSSPVGVAGHEATFSPDGRTLYTTASVLPYVTAIDVTNPSLPVPIWASTNYLVHGMNVSDDGNRLYAASLDISSGRSGVLIFDTSQIQARKPLPQAPVISHVTWSNVSIPQTAIPITISGHPYLVEIDEFAALSSFGPSAPVGAGRIIDIANERAPVVVSQLRLKVNEPDARQGDQASDPGASNPAGGYTGHYCSVPQRTDPGIVACSFNLSGLRVFDIGDPHHPTEIAYFNPPTKDIELSQTVGVSLGTLAPNLLYCQLALRPNLPKDVANTLTTLTNGEFPLYGTQLFHTAMSAPAFDPATRQVWYSDGLYGFYAVKLTNDVWEPATS